MRILVTVLLVVWACAAWCDEAAEIRAWHAGLDKENKDLRRATRLAFSETVDTGEATPAVTNKVFDAWEAARIRDMTNVWEELSGSYGLVTKDIRDANVGRVRNALSSWINAQPEADRGITATRAAIFLQSLFDRLAERLEQDPDAVNVIPPQPIYTSIAEDNGWTNWIAAPLNKRVDYLRGIVAP